MDLSQVSNATTKIQALSGLVLVSPQSTIGYQPKNEVGSSAALPEALLFHYEGENTVSLESDITDHFVEDNSAINDQIALRPETITVHGFIGELNDVAPAVLAPLKEVADKLVSISGYEPQLSASALIAYNEASFLYSTAKSAVSSVVSSYSTISNAITGETSQSVISSNGLNPSDNQNKQQTMFQQFYGYWRNRTLFTVQTPWAVFDNMAIKSLRAIQDQDTAVVTDFEVTFKIIRYAKEVTFINAQGRAKTQTSDLINFGTKSLSQSTETFSSSLSEIA